MKFLLLILWSFTLCAGEKKKFNYCSIKCKLGGFHAGCQCKLRPPRTEIKEDIVVFRKMIVEEHNKFRNMVAFGDITYEGEVLSDIITGVADMMVINYDLELEYLARCFAGNLYKEFRDKCRYTLDKSEYSQSITTDSYKGKEVQEMIRNWWYEVRSLDQPEYLAYFPGGYALLGTFGHFTQMIWSRANRVGCARVFVPADEEKNEKERLALICNYLGVNEETGNQLTKKILESGTACSACPKKSSCNTKYKGLCGQLLPVPEDPPPVLKEPTLPVPEDHPPDVSENPPPRLAAVSERLNKVLLFFTFNFVLLVYF